MTTKDHRGLCGVLILMTTVTSSLRPRANEPAERDVLTAKDAGENREVQGVIAQRLILAYKALGGGWEIRQGNEFVPPATVEEMHERTDWGDVIDPGYDTRTDLGFARPGDTEGSHVAPPPSR